MFTINYDASFLDHSKVVIYVKLFGLKVNNQKFKNALSSLNAHYEISYPLLCKILLNNVILNFICLFYKIKYTIYSVFVFTYMYFVFACNLHLVLNKFCTCLFL